MKTAPIQQPLSLEGPPSPLSSRPKRTRISYFALLATTTCAALRKESRMQIPNTTGLNRKSGGAQWRDLRSCGPFLGMFFDRGVMGLWAHQGDEKRPCSATTVDGGTALPFVISTGAKRSGGTCSRCGVATPNSVHPVAIFSERNRPSLCHLDRSVPGFPTSRCWQGPRVRFSLRKPHDVDQHHGSQQEIRGSAVERSAVQRSRLGNVLSKEGFFSSEWASYWSCSWMPFPSSFKLTEKP